MTELSWSGVILPVNVESDTLKIIAPGALNAGPLPLTVNNHLGHEVGTIDELEETDAGWVGSGRVRDTQPGRYPAAVGLQNSNWEMVTSDGRQVTRYTGGTINQLTFGPTIDPSFPEAHITVEADSPSQVR